MRPELVSMLEAIRTEVAVQRKIKKISLNSLSEATGINKIKLVAYEKGTMDLKLSEFFDVLDKLDMFNTFLESMKHI